MRDTKGDIKFTCCDHEMTVVTAHRDLGYDVRVVVYWCHQCGRLIRANLASNGMFTNDVFTPVDNYKGHNRECL